eukprot:g2134.t1
MKHHCIIDVRPPSSYTAGHIKGSTNLPFPFGLRSAELPPRHTSIALVAASAEELEVVSKKLKNNYTIEWGKVATPDICTEKGLTSRRLWNASPCLIKVIKKIEDKKPCFGEVIDIGCGSGRDCVYLASRGWNVIGIDNKAIQKERFESLVENSNIVKQCSFRLIDVEKEWCTNTNTNKQILHADVVHMARYLHRPLLRVIRDAIVRPGGFVVIHTFMRFDINGNREDTWNPKKEKFLLEDDELFKMFNDHSGKSVIGNQNVSWKWEVVLDEKKALNDGRPVCYFVAEKKIEASNPNDLWSGHVAFPGGRRQPSDNSDLHTAIRETYEEVGLDLNNSSLFKYYGALDHRSVFGSGRKQNNMVLCPFVFLQTAENDKVPPLQLDPSEVAAACWSTANSLSPSKWDEKAIVRNYVNERAFFPALQFIPGICLRILGMSRLYFPGILMKGVKIRARSNDNQFQIYKKMTSEFRHERQKKEKRMQQTVSDQFDEPEFLLWGMTLRMTSDILDLATKRIENSNLFRLFSVDNPIVNSFISKVEIAKSTRLGKEEMKNVNPRSKL